MSEEIQFRFQLPLGDFDLSAEATIPGTGVTALFGRSGSGKTSLLRCIAGLENTSDGHLEVNGEKWQESTQELFIPPEKRGIGYVFQEGALFPHLQVKANLLYGYKRTNSGERTEEFQRVVDLLGLAGLLERLPAQLSGGEKQRVAIGRALLNNPRLLLMDEPLAALDRDHKKEILPYLESLHRESRIPIIYVTHDLDELVRIADHLVLMERGKIIAQGALDEVLARMDLPIARDADAGAVINTTLISHDEEYHLSRLGFVGGEITVSWIDLPVGSEIRIRIHAKDVSLTLAPPGPTSILNILPGTVEAMEVHGRGRMLLRLDIGGATLLARITRKSQHHLGLEVGTKVYAQVKSVALYT
ncbi:MAG: molybdenum ABC transporter ATP-binding protein [Candidatus Sedimenticola sp. (ex Thyasira tokunagai)]